MIMWAGIIGLLTKGLDIILKTSINGEKEQDLKSKKLTIYSSLVIIIILTALFMCVLASLFPGLSITSWWFNFLEQMIKNNI